MSETCLPTRAGACGDQSVDIPPVARRRRLMSCDGASLGSRSRIDISPLLNVLPAVTVPKIWSVARIHLYAYHTFLAVFKSDKVYAFHLVYYNGLSYNYYLKGWDESCDLVSGTHPLSRCLANLRLSSHKSKPICVPCHHSQGFKQRFTNPLK